MISAPDWRRSAITASVTQASVALISRHSSAAARYSRAQARADRLICSRSSRTCCSVHSSQGAASSVASASPYSLSSATQAMAGRPVLRASTS